MKTRTLAFDSKKVLVLLMLVSVILIFTILRGLEVSKPKVIYGEIGAIKAVSIPKAAVPVKPLPLVPPQVLNQVLPVYPLAAREKGVEGITVLRAMVGTDGAVKQVETKISSGSKLLDDSAVAAVSKWKFSPASQGGMALASTFEIPVTFKLQ